MLLISEQRLSGHGGISEGVHTSGQTTAGVCCPICGMPLRSCDLEAHYTQELDYLAKLSAALIVSQQNQHNVSSSPFVIIHKFTRKIVKQYLKP